MNSVEENPQIIQFPSNAAVTYPERFQDGGNSPFQEGVLEFDFQITDVEASNPWKLHADIQTTLQTLDLILELLGGNE